MAQHVLVTISRALYDTLVMSNGSSAIQAVEALTSGEEGKKGRNTRL